MTASEERTLRRTGENTVEELSAIRGYLARLTIAVETIAMTCEELLRDGVKLNTHDAELNAEALPSVLHKSTP
jgi:hypothetical protein